MFLNSALDGANAVINGMYQSIEKSASEIEKATKESANAIYEAMQKSVENLNIY